jgi:putative hydrolase of HD superfamily
MKRIGRSPSRLDDPKTTLSTAGGTAMMVWLLSYYHDIRIDLLKALKMALIHDLVEITAGDTWFLDDQEGKKDRENVAAKSFFAQLLEPLRSEFLKLWDEFELQQTPEARLC